ncbi:alpha/beta fold hydrolase [Streptomyces sp. NPDC089799]|uniref:thioesterase II family protein n=1 Tax=Streptomyces sp. NPDC089799 TaxID=3155066 RepID=UPI00343D217D
MNRIPRRDRGWLRDLNSVESPAGRMVCLPHSGGSAVAYRPWSRSVPADLSLMAVQYPGHADRLGEPFAGGIAELGAGVAGDLLRLDPAPCVLFGHSLGALVAYETARVLQEAGSPPAYLFLSGAPAPSQHRGGITHEAGDEELWDALCGLGGMDPAVAADTELRDLMLPVLRADIALSLAYRPAPDAVPLNCAVRCHYNTEDPLVDAERISAWAEVGTGPFSVRAWPGGHFRLFSDPAAAIGDIVTALAGAGVAVGGVGAGAGGAR